MAKVRCKSDVALTWIRDALDVARKDYKEIGRPLTLRLHDKPYRSLLEGAVDTKDDPSKKVSMAGITNLLGLLLLITNVKNVLTSLKD